VRDARDLRGQSAEVGVRFMATHAIAMIARGVRSFWLGSLATLRLEADSAASPRSGTSGPTANREAAGPGYSFKYTNGLQTIQDTQGREFATERAARREALRTAREMAGSVSWQSSARGAGWIVLVIDPMGQQVCEVPVRLKKRWL
jgi:hypothetical protein